MPCWREGSLHLWNRRLRHGRMHDARVDSERPLARGALQAAGSESGPSF